MARGRVPRPVRAGSCRTRRAPISAARPRAALPRYARSCRATRPRRAGHEPPPAGRGGRSWTAGWSWTVSPCRPSGRLRRGRPHGSFRCTAAAREHRRCGWTWIGLPGGGAGNLVSAPTSRPEEADLERLKPRREAWQRETPVAPLRQEEAELPLPGSKRPRFRANRGRRPRLWFVG